MRAPRQQRVEDLFSPLWPAAFPQHGPGKKHLRPIELEPWQEEILDADPRPFVRGLIHSDGPRCINRFTTELKDGVATYEYPRYFFTNYSADIRGLFCRYCERLGIHCTQSSFKNISVCTATASPSWTTSSAPRVECGREDSNLHGG